MLYQSFNLHIFRNCTSNDHAFPSCGYFSNCQVSKIVILKYLSFKLNFLNFSYHTFSTEWYIILALILPVIFGIIFFIWGFIETDDEIVIFCNPPLGKIIYDCEKN